MMLGKQIGLSLLLMLLCQLNSYANEFWKKDYSKIDSIALTVKSTTNLEKLVYKLTNHCKSDVEKYRSIFTWIAHNISYDLEGLKDRTKVETEPKEIIKSGTAVCAGYANLFNTLCGLANLECVTISGWGKEIVKIGQPLGTKTTHAWNAIKIKDGWYLCDATWGAGSTTMDMKVFSFKFNDFYFCTPPELFSVDHFPEEKKWFLSGEVSEKKFINSPYFFASAFHSNMKVIDPKDGIIDYKADRTIDFKFSTKEIVNRVSIKSSNSKSFTNIEFTVNGDEIEFNYNQKIYSPYLFVYINRKAAFAYKLIK